jgi:putative flavoprotein involved in K+ transport
MSGRDVGHVPFKINSRITRWFIARVLFRGLFHRVLTLDTPMGRKVRPEGDRPRRTAHPREA